MKRLLPLLTVISLLMWTGSSAAQEASERACEVCLSKRAVAQCKDDAKNIDGTRARLRECQRQRDADAGLIAELRAGDADQTARILALELTLAEERRRWPVRRAVGLTTAVLCASATAYGAWRRDAPLIIGAVVGGGGGVGLVLW